MVCRSTQRGPPLFTIITAPVSRKMSSSTQIVDLPCYHCSITPDEGACVASPGERCTRGGTRACLCSKARRNDAAAASGHLAAGIRRRQGAALAAKTSAIFNLEEGADAANALNSTARLVPRNIHGVCVARDQVDDLCSPPPLSTEQLVTYQASRSSSSLTLVVRAHRPRLPYSEGEDHPAYSQPCRGKVTFDYSHALTSPS